MQQFLPTWQDYLNSLNRMATDPGEEMKRSIAIFHKLVKGSDALKVSLNAYDMAKRSSYKRSYDFPKAAASAYARAEQAPRQQSRRSREGQPPQHQQQGSRDVDGCGLQWRDA